MTRIGLIGDTHGLLRPEVARFLEGCGVILHCGDVGSRECLERIGKIAPVHAVRGNVDTGDWAAALPARRIVQVEGVSFHIVHHLEDLMVGPMSGQLVCGLYGHTHRPEMRTRNGVVLINPGSPGPKRFSLPISVAEAVVMADSVTFRLHLLDESSGKWLEQTVLECSGRACEA